jgi:hypothetical protein
VTLFRALIAIALSAATLALAAPAHAYTWPSEVLVVGEEPVGGSLLASLEPGTLVHRTTAAELAQRCPRHATVLIWPSALEDSEGAAALDGLFDRAVTLVFPDGIPLGMEVSGIGAQQAPPYCRAERVDLPHLPKLQPPAETPASLRLSAASLAGARMDALLALARKGCAPEALAAVALRYYEGDRAGSRIAVGCGLNLEELASLLEFLDRPFLTRAEADYPLIRKDEDLRVLVDARIRASDPSETRVRLTIPGNGRFRRAEWSGADGPWERVKGANGLDTLAGEALATGRSWQGPVVEIVAELRRPDGELLDRVTSVTMVEATRAPAKPAAPLATWSRLLVGGSDVPSFTAELPAAPFLLRTSADTRSDLSGWQEAIESLADHGARTVRLPAADDPDGTHTEWRRRTNQALAQLAIFAGVTPEFVLMDGMAPAGLLGDGPGPEALSPRVLASSDDDDLLDPLRDVRPTGKVARRPAEPTEGSGLLPPLEEMMARGATDLVRARPAGPVTPGDLWTALLLGSGGAWADARTSGPTLAGLPALLEANAVSRLLSPGPVSPQVALLRSEGDEAEAHAAEEFLNNCGLDWAPCPLEDAHQYPVGAIAALYPCATPLPDSAQGHLAAWVMGGGTLILPQPELAGFLEDPSAPPIAPGASRWRLGRGWLIEWPGAEAGYPALRADLESLGARSCLEPASADVRVLRAKTDSGEEILAAFALAGGARRVTLRSGEFAVTLGLAPGQPAAVCIGEAGPTLVSGLGPVVLATGSLLDAPETHRVTLAALDGVPLPTSASYLIFVDGPGACEIGLRRNEPRWEQRPSFHTLAPAGRTLVTLRKQALRHAGDVEWLPLTETDLNAPLLLGTDERIDVSERRLAELLWGRR